jgi:hypothetical protein
VQISPDQRQDNGFHTKANKYSMPELKATLKVSNEISDRNRFVEHPEDERQQQKAMIAPLMRLGSMPASGDGSRGGP